MFTASARLNTLLAHSSWSYSWPRLKSLARYSVVPVIDMRLKFRLDKAEYNALTVMIVLNVASRVVGIVVDSVSDVIALNAEQIRPTPEFGASVDTRFISGIGTVDDRMLILLDIETLIDSADFGQPLPEQVAA